MKFSIALLFSLAVHTFGQAPAVLRVGTLPNGRGGVHGHNVEELIYRVRKGGQASAAWGGPFGLYNVD